MEYNRYLLACFFHFYLLRSSIFLIFYFLFFKSINFIFFSRRKKINLFYKNLYKQNDTQETIDGYVINNSNISFNELDHFFFTCKLLNSFKKLNLTPIIFQTKQFNSKFKKLNFNTERHLIFYSNLKNSYLNLEAKKIIRKNIKEIIDYSYEGVSCGKYAISTSMRMLRVAEIDLKNEKHKLCLLYNLKKSILYTNASYNYLNKYKIKFALFNDRGYTGEGELYDICVNKGITCIQYISTYKNNSLLLKKFEKRNKSDHPSSVGQKIWNKFSEKNLTETQKIYLHNEIKNGYLKNTWYPSAGTMVGKNLRNTKDILTEIGIKNSKKNAVIFPHIFWDGTFFYGNDLFISYEEWFKQTLKFAEKNRNINWIIKSHPSNQTKNYQDKIKEQEIEPELEHIINLFGKLPDNFYYLSSKSKINTFYLLDILDYCVTVRGTVGIEAAMRGKDVITAGTGRYDNKGFTNNFMNFDEYKNTITNLHKFKSNLTRVEELAKKFAYISLICKNYSPKNFNFFYTNDLKSKLQVTQNDEQSLNENDDIDLLNWLSNLEEDYFKDPLNQWIK